MDSNTLYHRYQELQAYVGWTEENARQVQSVAQMLEPHLPGMVDDFYEEIEKHPNARKVITGGADQIQRLKGTLLNWLQQLLSGPYDQDYVLRRWRVGWRHVEIGLDQVFTIVALSRLRGGLLHALEKTWQGEIEPYLEIRKSLNTLLDLDMAVIEDAYQAEYSARQQRVERLAALGQIAGGVAHELRNPLNVVRTSVYYLLNARNPTPEKKAEHLKRIENQVLLADGVITALSRFAKLPVPELLPFNVLDCIREALETNPVPDTIQVDIQSEEQLPAALGDKDQVRIVVGNLIRNAREAMPSGGKLTITARRVEDCVEIQIADTGVGIGPEHLSRIMEPLYSTKARGLGLGLAIARAILEKNNGKLLVASELGKGSLFTVSLQAISLEEKAP